MNADPVPWTGVVLAGGRSRRMGQDKAGLDWHGQPLLAHMAGLLAQAGAARVVVSGAHPGFDGIPDAWPDLGPLGGLASVADALPDDVLVFVPVDMPRLSPGLLRDLAGLRGVACASYRDHILPMRLQVDAHCRATLARLLRDSSGRRSVRELHAAMEGAFIDIEAGRMAELVNCNTPAQWLAVIA